jgi:predicted DNA-binding transcriptional regulator AlpA
MSADALRFPALTPPVDRGRLLKAAEVAAIIGGVSETWVRRNVPNKVALGHSTCRWYQADVRAFLESRRAS